MSSQDTNGGEGESAELSRAGSNRRIVNRRNLLKSSGAASVALLAGCVGGGDGGDGGSTPTPDESTPAGSTPTTGSSTKPFEDETLAISVWSGEYVDWWKPNMQELFKEETGATLKLVPGWSDLLAKIKAAPKDDPPYDICITEGWFYMAGRRDDLFLSIEDWDIPLLNTDNLYPYILEFREPSHGVPFDGAPNAIMYNNDLIDYDLQTWTDLIDNETPTALEGGFYAYMVHIAALLVDNMEGTEEVYNRDQWDAIFDKIGEFNVQSWYDSGAQAWQQLKQQIVHASMWYAGTGAGRAQEHDWVSVTLPDRTSGYFDHFCPVRGTQKKELSKYFLNWLLKPDVQTAFAQEGANLLSSKGVEYNQWSKDHGYPQSNEDWKRFQFPDYQRLNELGLSTDLSNRYQNFQKQ